MIVKKGQVALEFLMTYGWAMMIILIAIGALAYFGLFEVDSIIPERCEFGGQGLTCTDTAAIDSSSKQVLLLVQNVVGQTINLTSITTTEDCTLSNFEFCDTGNNCAGLGVSKQISNGETFIIKITCLESFSGRFRSDITVSYVNIETTLNSYNLAQVRGNVD